MIIIEPPKIEYWVTEKELNTIPDHTPGVYFLFNKQDQAVYIGITTNMKSRLKDHFYGITNVARYKGQIYKAGFFIEPNKLHREIYELYLIDKHQYEINMVGKAEVVKGKAKTPSAQCLFIKDNGQQCKHKATTNGYCRFHGGNGISKAEIVRKATRDFYESFKK